MDPACFPATIISSHPIKDVKEAALALMEHHFKVSCAATARISCPPFNVKLPVGRRPRDRGEHAAATGKVRAIRRYLIGAKIALKQKNSPVPTRIRQGQTAIGRIKRIACKVQSAIIGDVRTGKGEPINGDREWECNRSGAIIAVVACVGVPGDDDACRSRRSIIAAWNRRCRRRWRRRGRWAAGAEDEVQFQTVRQPARLALKLREVRAGVALRAHGSVLARVAIQGAIYHFEVGRILV